uniref:hypothetical protein n=1 Tax=Marinobacter vulgaris TaxID=1928331 RepID=UPI0018F1510A|nr:hypothetical protein [Marinobacter vulgaris]
MLPAIRLWIGIDGTENTAAPGVGVFDTFTGTLVIEIQPRKLAGVGAATEAEIDCISAIVHGGFQGWQTTSRAYELHGYLHCKSADTIPPPAQGAP